MNPFIVVFGTDSTIGFFHLLLLLIMATTDSTIGFFHLLLLLIMATTSEAVRILPSEPTPFILRFLQHTLSFLFLSDKLIHSFILIQIIYVSSIFFGRCIILCSPICILLLLYLCNITPLINCSVYFYSYCILSLYKSIVSFLFIVLLCISLLRLFS